MTKRDKKEKAAEPEETAPAEKKAKTDTQEEASAEAAAAPPAAEPPSIFDHISLPVSDYGKSIEFYKAALKPLGVEVKMEFGEGRERSAGLGVKMPVFWLSGSPEGVSVESPKGQHLCFAAGSRKLVTEWYEAAIAAGGKDNGKPGLRPDYHKDYFGAFVLDPDGHRLEAVCHAHEE